MNRSRARLAVALAVTIALGLGSRSATDLVPAFVRAHAGDALWTVALWLVLGLVSPSQGRLRLTALALVGSLLVEASQAWHVGWLDAIRSTLPGRLVLGVGWDPLDPLRYLAGCLGIAGLDRLGLFGRPDRRDGTLS